MHSDRIFVLEKGQIVESGKHHDLLALKGLYYAMWRQQIGERHLHVHASTLAGIAMGNGKQVAAGAMAAN